MEMEKLCSEVCKKCPSGRYPAPHCKISPVNQMYIDAAEMTVLKSKPYQELWHCFYTPNFWLFKYMEGFVILKIIY